MLHIVEARARRAAEVLSAKRQLEVPHPEQAGFCKDAGPCGGKDANGTPLDSAYACLTRASAYLAGDPERADRAHARACRCNPTAVEVPVQGGTGLLGCDKGKKVRWGASLSLSEAEDVELCSQCDPVQGPKACAREIERLRSRDEPLSKHIAAVHVPRCSRPAE